VPLDHPDLPTILPEGVEPPEELDRAIFDAATQTFLGCRRLDMRGLATELGIGRATLYRRAGSRDRLLGEVVWYLTRIAIARSLPGTERMKGADRVRTVVERFMRDVHSQPALRRFLEAEPEAALRILTSKHAGVQQGIVTAIERLIGLEEERGHMRTSLDHPTLAYVIVRIGESFLYGDVIADNEPNVDRAVDVINRLLREA
jgi:AcrR family transcriptional regulator